MNITTNELKNLKPIVISIIGPTNEGKTSILRTLTGDSYFGNVNAYTGTTEKPEIQKVFYKGCELLQLIDTPGFQISSRILELLDQDETVRENNGRFTLKDILRVIPGCDENFRHDYRAWKELERCSVGILVINVKESPHQSLFEDSLKLLEASGKPIIALFNNIASDKTALQNDSVPDMLREWRSVLVQHRFYSCQVYDAHLRSLENEIRLFEKTLTFLDDPIQDGVLRLEMENRRNLERQRLDQSRRIIAELMLDVVCYLAVKNDVDLSNRTACVEELQEEFKQTVINREHRAHMDLLDVWGFRSGILNRKMMDLDREERENDELFGKNVGKHLKIGSGIGVGAGMVLGGIIEAGTLGMSMGGGIALGALIGGMFGGGTAGFFNHKYDRKNKKICMQLPEANWEILLVRAVELVKKLETRGMAVEDGTQLLISDKPAKIDVKDIMKELARVSGNTSLSLMLPDKAENTQRFSGLGIKRLLNNHDKQRRQEEVIRLATLLEKNISNDYISFQ